MSVTTDRPGTGGFASVPQRHWFGVAEVPGEPTAHSALRITPRVHAERAPRSRGVRHQLRWSGYWAVIHVPTGNEVCAGHWLPLAWTRRFAHLLATSGLDWDRMTGDTRLVTHPQYAAVRALGAHVLDCWRRGVPVVDRLLASLSIDDDQLYGLSCANPHCEDEIAADGHPVVLTGGEDGQDELRLPEHELGKLAEIAFLFGWDRLDDRDHWLCATCAYTHQPAPPQLAPRLLSVSAEVHDPV